MLQFPGQTAAAGMFPTLPRNAVVFFASAVCALTVPAQEPGTGSFQERRTWSFPEDGVFFSNEFSGARLNAVTRTGPNNYRQTITSETDPPINNSPWYAFRVWSTSSRTITNTVSYPEAGITHRYRPRYSSNLNSWTLVAANAISVDATETQAAFTMPASSTVRTVVGQQLITWEDQLAWAANFTNLPFVRMQEIGRSVQGRPMVRLDTATAPPDSSGTLILMAGQHPPEVPGTRAFRNFTEEIFNDTSLAREFRRRFNVVVLPLMNPDGWHHGHWRDNANRQDLNRAWTGSGLTNSPEVRAAIASLKNVTNAAAFIDFHSTTFNIFYTANDETERPPYFVPEYIARVNAGTEPFGVTPWPRSISEGTIGTTSRFWVASNLGCAAFTWEFSDTASETRIREGGRVGAQQMMSMLLELWRDNHTSPVVRYDFEDPVNPWLPAATPTGAITTVAVAPSGTRSAELSGGYFSLADFDYGSTRGATLALWFRMDERPRGDFAYLFGHGTVVATNSFNVYWRAANDTLRVSVMGANDPQQQVEIPDNSFIGRGWQHLAVVLQPGEGTTVYLNGLLQGSMTNGGTGVNPAGSIGFGINNVATAERNFVGGLDDVRLYSSPLTPWQLATIQHRDSPAEPYRDWRDAAFASLAYGGDNAFAADLSDADTDGLSNLEEYAYGGNPLAADSQALQPRLHLGAGGYEVRYRRRIGAPNVESRVWTSADLVNWQTGPPLLGETGTVPAGMLFEEVAVRALGAPADENRRFFRLETIRRGN